MIVISGALVLVALVLLVIGLVGPSLGFVYASIGASLAAFVFLVVGVLQRRKEDAVIDGAPSSAADIAAAIRTPDTAPAESAALGGLVGEVLVVEGRPRYHVAGCRYLAGKDARGVEVGQAQADGFTACGVCKPDESLASAPVAAPDAHVALVEPDTEAVATVSAAGKRAATKTAPRTAPRTSPRTAAKKAAPARATKAAAPAKAGTATKKAAPAKAAAKKAAPAKSVAKAAAKPVTKTVAKAPAKAAAKAAAKKAPAKKAPAKKAAAKAPAKKASAKRS
ncbi:MAG TPA: hypothetical protein VM097_01525 [Mycobacteriales bacterium]|nr:hypothetical protein [Mycobacteriales bacterium]